MKWLIKSIVPVLNLLLISNIAISQKINIVDTVKNSPFSEKEYKKIKKEADYTLVNLHGSSSHIILFKDRFNNSSYVFVVTEKQLKNWFLYKISTNETANQEFVFDENMLKKHPGIITPEVVNFINSTTQINDSTVFEKGFTNVILVYLKYAKPVNPALPFYRALYLKDSLFKANSRIIQLDDIESVPPNDIKYIKSDIPFNPPQNPAANSKDSVVFKVALKATLKKTKPDTTLTYVFDHSCSGGYNFNVKIKPDKNGGVIYLHNNSNFAKAANSNVKPAAKKNTATPVKISQPKGGTAPDTLSGDTFVNPPDTSYTYSKNTGFDGANYVSWLKNIYPKINDDCAMSLASKIKEELRPQDTITPKANAATISSVNTPKAKGATTSPVKATKPAKTSKPVKPGSMPTVSATPITAATQDTAIVVADTTTEAPAPDKSKNKNSPDTSNWFLSIVTGGNFDFFNGASIKNFAGDITFFLPNLFKIYSLPVGVEFGLANFHYYNNDSTHTDYYRDSYFQHYKDFFSPSATSNVIIETKNVNRKYDYNVWGIHIDPMTPLYSDDLVQLYGKIHMEELMTIETYTPKINSTTYDTVTYQQYQNAYTKGTLATLAVMPSPSEDPFYQYRQHTYHDLYFGTGFGLVINFKKVAKFSGSTTVGIASLELAPINNFFPNDPSNRNVIQNMMHMRTGKFYTLNRFQFVTTVAPIDIAIGGEYRTVASNMYYFSTYIGASISLDKIKK